MNEANTGITRCGTCHCGAVRFTVRFATEELTGSRCNCSICAMKGAVMVYVPASALEVVAGADALTCYAFNTGIAKHHFCKHCGIHCFHQARSDPGQYAVNAACLEGVRPYEDFAQVAVADGQHHALDNAGVRRLSGVLHFEPAPENQ